MASASVPSGTLVFVAHEEHSYLPAQVVRAIGSDGGEVELLHGNEEDSLVGSSRNDDVKIGANKQRFSVQSCDDVSMMDAQTEQGVANMVNLRELNEASILHNLRVRFARDEIYTSVGSILVAVNPFKLLPLYTPEVLDAYRTDRHGTKDAPHVFQVADAAYKALLSNKEDQSCIISGESGAGKTETTKLFLQFLTEVSSSADAAASLAAGSTTDDDARNDFDQDSTFGLQERILQANPLMEAFGNAKTVRNNNSSRFGKWIQIKFDTKRGSMTGGQITSYLLEKSRIVSQSPGERNYHIFYQLCTAAANDDELQKRLRLGAADEYHYLNQSATYLAEGINDEREWERVMRGLEVIKVPRSDVKQCLNILAGILHLGNLSFDERVSSGDGQAILKNSVVLDVCANLFGVERGVLERVLTTRSMGVRSVIYKPYTAQEAMNARDALAKAIYSQLFDWLIARINNSLAEHGQASSSTVSHQSIGVLDIFGFECFVENSFEQLCINFCNEKLQHHFNEHIFEQEQAEYAREGIDACSISFINNLPCVEALEARSSGVFAMIDEEISIPRGSDNGLLSKILQQSSKYIQAAPVKARNSRTSFAVNHYAGSVIYDVSGFLEKNKDALHTDLQECMALSKNTLVKSFFDQFDNGTTMSMTSSRASSKAKRKTLGSKFKDQLGFLVTTLNATQPHFVRCIKPNAEKQGDIFTSPMVLAQLRYAGLLEVCRIRQQGFPVRIADEDFVHRYGAILSTSAAPNAKAVCDGLLKHNGLFDEEAKYSVDDWRIGRTKVFLRTHLHARLEHFREKALFSKAVCIQALVRRFLQRLAWQNIRDCLQNIAEAQTIESLEAAILASSDLPHGGEHIPAVQNAKTRLHQLGEQLRAENLLRDALGCMEEAALKTALKVAQTAGLDNNNQKFREAQNALTRVQEAREVHDALLKAVTARNLPEICTLLEKATQELGMTPEQDNAVQQATTLRDRLQGETQLSEKLDHVIATGQTSKEIQDVLTEIVRWGLPKTEKMAAAQTIATMLCTIEEAAAARDYKKLQDALSSPILPAGNRPAKAQALLETLGLENALEIAMREDNVAAIAAGLAKLDADAPASLRAAAQRKLEQARVLDRLRSDISHEDLADVVTQALKLNMDPTSIPELAKAQASLDASDNTTTQMASVLTRLTIARDLEGLKSLPGASDSPEIQSAIRQVKLELDFIHSLSTCKTVQQVEVCCMNSKCHLSEPVSNAAKQISLALEVPRSLEKLAEVEVLAEENFLPGVAAVVRAAQAGRRNEIVLERRLRSAVQEENRAEAHVIMEQLDRSNPVYKECKIWLDREKDIGQLIQDLKHAMRVLDLDKINIFVNHLLQSGATLDSDLFEELQNLLKELKAQRNQCAEVYEETKALQSRAQTPMCIAMKDLEPLQAALETCGADPSALEIQRANALILQLEAQYEAQETMEEALKADRFKKLKEALEIAQEQELEHLDLVARVRKALRVRDRERRAKQRAAFETGDSAPRNNARRNSRARPDDDDEDDPYESEWKESSPESGDSTTQESRAEAVARERQLREERRDRARQTRFEFIHYHKIRSDEDFARGVFLHKSRTIRLKCTFQPSSISKSLLDHGSDKELNKVAVRIHKAILGYCRDKAMSFPATMAQDILIKGLDLPDIVDEIYVLLCKHLTHNPRPESVGRGWQLVCMCVSTFPPSVEFEPYLLNFFLAHYEVPGLIGNYARFALRRLEGMIHSGPSGFVPTVAEIQAYNDRPPVLARIDLMDGSVLTEELPVTPDLDVGKVSELCAHFLGLHDERKSFFGIELNGDIPLRAVDYLGDAYMRANRDKTDFKLVFKRIVALRFSGLDLPSDSDPMFNRLVYLQVQREFIQGKYASYMNQDMLTRLVALSYSIDRGQSALNTSAEELAHTLPGRYVYTDGLTDSMLMSLAHRVLQSSSEFAPQEPAALQLQFWDIIRPLPGYGVLSFATNAERNAIHISDKGIELGGQAVGFERIHRWGGNAKKFTLIIWNPATQSEEEHVTLATPHGVYIGGALLNFISHIMDYSKDGSGHDET